MFNTIKKLGSENFERFLGVGTTDLHSGSYVFFNSSSQNNEDMLLGIYASVSDYAFFPYINFKHFKLVSGNIKFAVDILHAINACYEQGYAQEKITIDIIVDSGKKLKTVDASQYKTLQNFMRYLEIYSFNNCMQVIENAKLDFPLINIRSIIYPSKQLHRTLYPYDYSKEEIVEMLKTGARDAENSNKSVFII